MSIVNTVGRGVAWNTVSTIVAKVVIFANVFIILRTLTVYDYGLSQLVLSVISTISIFLLPGLNSVIIADMGAERTRGEFGKMKALFLQFLSLNMLLGIVAWAALFFFADRAAALAGNPAIGTLIKISSFSLLVTPFRVVSTMLATIELRYFDQALYTNLEEFVKFVALCFLFFAFDMGVYGLLYAIVISQFVTVLLYLPRSLSAYRVFGRSHAEDPHAFWRMLQDHRKWGVANSYLGTLASTVQIWIIRFFLGTEAVGLFSFAEGIYSQVTAFLPLGSVLAPLLPRYVDQSTEFIRYVKSAVKAQLILCVPLLVATFVGLPILILIFPKYGPAVPIMLGLMWSIFPAAVVAVYAPAFAALKSQYAFFWSTVWKIIFTVIGTALGVYVWGVPGIGIGSTLILLASMIERTLRLQGVLPEFTLSVSELFDFDPHERMLIRKAAGRLPYIAPLIPKHWR